MVFADWVSSGGSVKSPPRQEKRWFPEFLTPAKRLPCGGGDRRILAEALFDASVGVTAAPLLGCRQSENTVVNREL